MFLLRIRDTFLKFRNVSLSFFLFSKKSFGQIGIPFFPV